MFNTATNTEPGTAPQQLTLLTVPATQQTLRSSDAHERFRLSKTTRQRGLAHVAEIRAQLAAQRREAEAKLASAPLPARSAVAIHEHAA